MSDLLDRLNTWRVSCGRPDLCGEAIAEIERLKAENAQLRKMFEELVEESKLDVAEGARLRALNAELVAALEKSVTLQSHYAAQLNVYDDGQRMQFSGAQHWMKKVEGK